MYPIKGLILQARRARCDHRDQSSPVGTFKTDESISLTTANCSGSFVSILNRERLMSNSNSKSQKANYFLSQPRHNSLIEQKNPFPNSTNITTVCAVELLSLNSQYFKKIFVECPLINGFSFLLYFIFFLLNYFFLNSFLLLPIITQFGNFVIILYICAFVHADDIHAKFMRKASYLFLMFDGVYLGYCH